MGATPVVAADELDPGRERRPLESYFQEIGGTRTLKREEEVYLAKDLEAATAYLRESLYAIPCSSRHVVERWDALRALSHTGAKLSESSGDEETGEIAARVERAVKRLRALLEERVKKFDKAAHQFEIYHTYDNVDRENGIWRFMSQTRSVGPEKARKGLLEYKKTDRPPYPWLYLLYAGKMKPEQVLIEIKKAGFDQRYETRVRFHADLYLGIHYELNGNQAKSLEHLRKATANAYGRATGTYMWQVARVHHDLLAKKLAAQKPKSKD